jgi:hypothetical protein
MFVSKRQTRSSTNKIAEKIFFKIIEDFTEKKGIKKYSGKDLFELYKYAEKELKNEDPIIVEKVKNLFDKDIGEDVINYEKSTFGFKRKQIWIKIKEKIKFSNVTSGMITVAKLAFPTLVNFGATYAISMYGPKFLNETAVTRQIAATTLSGVILAGIDVIQGTVSTGRIAIKLTARSLKDITSKILIDDKVWAPYRIGAGILVGKLTEGVFDGYIYLTEKETKLSKKQREKQKNESNKMMASSLLTGMGFAFTQMLLGVKKLTDGESLFEQEYMQDIFVAMLPLFSTKIWSKIKKSSQQAEYFYSLRNNLIQKKEAEKILNEQRYYGKTDKKILQQIVNGTKKPNLDNDKKQRENVFLYMHCVRYAWKFFNYVGADVLQAIIDYQIAQKLYSTLSEAEKIQNSIEKQMKTSKNFDEKNRLFKLEKQLKKEMKSKRNFMDMEKMKSNFKKHLINHSMNQNRKNSTYKQQSEKMKNFLMLKEMKNLLKHLPKVH